MTPLLVDSSVWIQCFSKHPELKFVQILEQAKEEKRLATCGMIYLEVLRGSRNKTEYKELSEEFQSMHWFLTEEAHWQFASEIGFYLSQKGLHPPGTDLFIAALAIQNRAQLLHQDKHFLQIARYFPLKLV